jgi:hypothetical protein
MNFIGDIVTVLVDISSSRLTKQLENTCMQKPLALLTKRLYFPQCRNATAGGPPSIGHFWPPFAPLRRPLPPPSPKNFRSVYHFGSQKIFQDIPLFFLNTKKIFRKHLKIFRIYDIFPRN